MNKDHTENCRNDIRTIVADVIDIIKWIFIYIVISLIVLNYIIQIGVVNGRSMEPTLQDGDVLVMQRLGYTPARGDIVFLWGDNEYLVKRIIAVGGDTISINPLAGIVYINGEAIDEPYIDEPTYFAGNAFNDVIVPDGCYFVMGDNRNNSLDSRCEEVGMVTRSQITSGYMVKVPFITIGRGVDNR